MPLLDAAVYSLWSILNVIFTLLFKCHYTFVILLTAQLESINVLYVYGVFSRH